MLMNTPTHLNVVRVPVPIRPRVRAYARPEEAEITIRFVRHEPYGPDIVVAPGGAVPFHVRTCVLCGRFVPYDRTSPKLFLAHTHEVVCIFCAQKHAPQVLDMLSDYRFRSPQLLGLTGTPARPIKGRKPVLARAYRVARSSGPQGPETTMMVEVDSLEEAPPDLNAVFLAIRPDVSRKDADELLDAMIDVLAHWPDETAEEASTPTGESR